MVNSENGEIDIICELNVYKGNCRGFARDDKHQRIRYMLVLSCFLYYSSSLARACSLMAVKVLMVCDIIQMTSRIRMANLLDAI